MCSHEANNTGKHLKLHVRRSSEAVTQSHVNKLAADAEVGGGQDDLNPCLWGWLVGAEEGNTAGGTQKTRPDIVQVMPERPD